MTANTDARGMPSVHEPAADSTSMMTAQKPPGMARYIDADYTQLPNTPKPVAAARKNMDDAAALIEKLDAAAFDLVAKYRAAPGDAQREAHQAVAAGKTPASTAELDSKLDEMARQYRDTVMHRKAVEAHLSNLVDAYHAEAEKHFPAWRDTVAAELDSRAEPARVALAKALAEVRAVYQLAEQVEDMDRPRMHRDDRTRKSALSGRELPEVFALESSGHSIAGSGGDAHSFAADADAAGRLASMWLRVEGREKFGTGPIPESLTLPVSDLPPEDQDRIAREEHQREQYQRAHDYFGMSKAEASHVFKWE